MRLARFSAGGDVRLGVVSGEQVLDLSGCSPGIGLPSDMRELVGLDLDARLSLLRRAAWSAVRLPLDAVRLEAPIARPSSFFGVGMNSKDHARELATAADRPELRNMVRVFGHLQAAFPSSRFPMLFTKSPSCVTGPYDPIWIPSDSDQVDYEGELAVVIGRRARRLTVAEVPDVIAGYTVCNDVSVRDWQLESPTMWGAKSFETHGPIGPWIVTADELDPHELWIRTSVNGEPRQDGSIREFIHGIAEIVVAVSWRCTLQPGDLIATGTPGGVGMVDGRYLRAGDVVRVEIEGIGAIENPVIAEPINR